MTGPQPRPSKLQESEGTLDTRRRDGKLDRLDAQGDFRIPDGLEPPELRMLEDMVDCLPKGVTGRLDSTAIWMMCEYHKVHRLAMVAWSADHTDDKARLSATQAGDRWAKLAASFGMTPSGRAQVAQPEPGDDELDALVGRMSESD